MTNSLCLTWDSSEMQPDQILMFLQQIVRDLDTGATKQLTEDIDAM